MDFGTGLFLNKTPSEESGGSGGPHSGGSGGPPLSDSPRTDSSSFFPTNIISSVGASVGAVGASVGAMGASVGATVGAMGAQVGASVGAVGATVGAVGYVPMFARNLCTDIHNTLTPLSACHGRVKMVRCESYSRYLVILHSNKLEHHTMITSSMCLETRFIYFDASQKGHGFCLI